MTDKRVRKMEICMKGLKVEMKEVNRRLKLNDDAHLRIEQKIDELPDRLKGEFSGKWVENIVKVGLGVVLSGAIGLVIYLIERHLI